MRRNPRPAKAASARQIAGTTGPAGSLPSASRCSIAARRAASASLILRRRSEQRHVDVGEGQARFRKQFLRGGIGLDPERLRHGVAVSRQAPEQRGAVGDDVERRRLSWRRAAAHRHRSQARAPHRHARARRAPGASGYGRAGCRRGRKRGSMSSTSRSAASIEPSSNIACSTACAAWAFCRRSSKPRSVTPRPRATSPFSVIAQPDMVRNHQSSP